MSEELVLPRAGAANITRQPIAAPSDESFRKTFGQLLPPTKYIRTSVGTAAYYEIIPDAVPNVVPASKQDRVLVIHGIQTPAIGMMPLTKQLYGARPNAHFALVDLWGHGLSETPFLPHDQSLFHQLFDALLDQLQWHSAHFVGYSFGSTLTIGYVNSRPSRVQSFSLVAPAGMIPMSVLSEQEQSYVRDRDIDEPAAREWIHLWLEGGDLILPTDWEQRVARGEVVPQAVRKWEQDHHAGYAASVVGGFRDGGVFENDAAFAEAAASGIPNVVILGATDPVCSRHQAEAVGFKNVIAIEDAGHEVVRSKADEVASVILMHVL